MIPSSASLPAPLAARSPERNRTRTAGRTKPAAVSVTFITKINSRHPIANEARTADPAPPSTVTSESLRRGILSSAARSPKRNSARTAGRTRPAAVSVTFITKSNSRHHIAHEARPADPAPPSPGTSESLRRGILSSAARSPEQNRARTSSRTRPAALSVTFITKSNSRRHIAHEARPADPAPPSPGTSESLRRGILSSAARSPERNSARTASRTRPAAVSVTFITKSNSRHPIADEARPADPALHSTCTSESPRHGILSSAARGPMQNKAPVAGFAASPLVIRSRDPR